MPEATITGILAFTLLNGLPKYTCRCTEYSFLIVVDLKVGGHCRTKHDENVVFCFHCPFEQSPGAASHSLSATSTSINREPLRPPESWTFCMECSLWAPAIICTFCFSSKVTSFGSCGGAGHTASLSLQSSLFEGLLIVVTEILNGIGMNRGIESNAGRANSIHTSEKSPHTPLRILSLARTVVQFRHHPKRSDSRCSEPL